MRTAPTRIALYLVLAIAALLGGLWLLLGDSSTGEAALAEHGAAPQRDRDADLARAARDARRHEAADLAPPDEAVLIGVRRSGNGRLDGVVLDRATGLGLPGIRVDLTPLPPGGGEALRRILDLFVPGVGVAELVDPVATVASGDDGSFAFAGVEPGDYFLQGRGPHHVPDAIARARVDGSGSGGPIDVYCRAGGRIVGLVLDERDEPVHGARVVVMPGLPSLSGALRSGGLAFLESRTDEAGAFAVGGVPPGDDWEVTVCGARIALSQVGGLEVTAGADTQVVVHASAGGIVVGRVLSIGKDGAPPLPIAGAHVGAMPRGLRSLPHTREVLVRTHAITDEEGRYRMTCVPPGEVDVVGFAPEHLPAKGPSVWVGATQAARAEDFLLESGPLLHGRVVDTAGAPVAGVKVRWQVVDQSKMSLDLSLAPLVAQATRGFAFPETDADGRFTAGPFPGEPSYRVDFEREGYSPNLVQWDGSAEDVEVVLLGTATIEGVVMDAREHTPVTAFTIEVGSGRSSDAAEFRAAFTAAKLFESPQGRFRLESVILDSPSRGGASNVVLVGGDEALPEPPETPGPATASQIDLVFRAPGYLSAGVNQVTVAEGGTTRGIIVEMYQGGVVRGHVTDANAGPIAGAQVYCRLLENDSERPGEAGRSRVVDAPPGLTPYLLSLGLLGGETVLSGPDGAFELVGVEPGRNAVVAMHRDYTVGAGEPFTVPVQGPPVETAVVLHSGSVVHGKVVDRHSRPIPGAVVAAVSPGNLGGEDSTRGGFFETRADEGGSYRIEHVDAGVYFLVMARGDEALTPTSLLGSLNFDMLTVPEGEEVEYDIVDVSSGGTRVFGRVTASDRQISRGQVIAMGFESESMLGFDLKIARIADDGSYEFASLASGEYQFQLEGVGADVAEVRLLEEIPDAPEYRLDLHVPDGRIEGRVTDATTGEPIPGMTVRAQSSERIEAQGLLGQMVGRDAGVSSARTDELGRYAFEHLAAADYELVARPNWWASGDHSASEPLLVSLGTDEIERDVDFRLQRPLEVVVKVVDEFDQPVVGAWVGARSVERPEDVFANGASDEQGLCRLKGLAAGSYDLRARQDDYAEARAFAVELDPAATTPPSIHLHPGIEVRVTVYGVDGKPVSGGAGRLVAVNAQGVQEDEALLESMLQGRGVSDADGLLELGRFEPGEYLLEIRRGLAQSKERVTIAPGPPVTLSARLR